MYRPELSGRVNSDTASRGSSRHTDGGGSVRRPAPLFFAHHMEGRSMYSVILTACLGMSGDPGYHNHGGCQGYQASCHGCHGDRRRERRESRHGCQGGGGCYGGCQGGHGCQGAYAPAPPPVPIQSFPTPRPAQPMQAPPECPCTANGQPCTCVDCCCDQALTAVNQRRAARGLRPYILDPNLASGALGAARYRAQHGIVAHAANEYSFLAPGVMQWGPPDRWGVRVGLIHGGTNDFDSMGPTFMTCAMLDNYTYAGAATVRGADGRYFHQIFVR